MTDAPEAALTRGFVRVEPIRSSGYTTGANVYLDEHEGAQTSLTSEEIQEAGNQAIAALEEKFQGQLRS